MAVSLVIATETPGVACSVFPRMRESVEGKFLFRDAALITLRMLNLGYPEECLSIISQIHNCGQDIIKNMKPTLGPRTPIASIFGNDGAFFKVFIVRNTLRLGCHTDSPRCCSLLQILR